MYRAVRVCAVLVNFFIFIFIFVFVFIFVFIFIFVSFSIHAFIRPIPARDSLGGLVLVGVVVVVVVQVRVRVESGLLEVELLSLQSSLSHHCFACRKEPECSGSPSFVPLYCGPPDCFRVDVRTHACC